MADEFRVMAPDRKVHGEEIVDLNCKTFGNYFEAHPIMRELILRSSHYSFEHSRIGVMDGKIVTHFGILDYQMRVGAATLRTGGVGGVATHPDYRKRGLMLKTGEACLAGLRAAGFDFSLLFGIENFYHRLGYSRAWAPADYVVTLDKLGGNGRGSAIRKGALSPTDALAKLYNRQYAGITGTAVRPTFRSWREGNKCELFSWKGRRGQVAGYVIVRDAGAKLEVMEAVGESEAVLGAVGQLAKRFACDEIRFLKMVERSALGHRLRRGDMRVEVQHRRNSGPLARVVHLPRVMGKMAGELSQRLIAAGLGEYRGKLGITDERDGAMIAIDGGRVRVSEESTGTKHRLVARGEISQLILGTQEPWETIEAAEMQLKGDAKFLVPAMFPAQRPMLGWMDHF
jgi:predicted acetyltransferase